MSSEELSSSNPSVRTAEVWTSNQWRQASKAETATGIAAFVRRSDLRGMSDERQNLVAERERDAVVGDGYRASANQRL